MTLHRPNLTRTEKVLKIEKDLNGTHCSWGASALYSSRMIILYSSSVWEMMSILQRNFNQVAFLCLINNWAILEMALSYTIHGCLSEHVWQMERRKWKSERERERYIIVSEISLSLMVCAWIKQIQPLEKKKRTKDEVPRAWSRSRRAKVERGQVTLTAHRCTLKNRSEPTCRDSTAG